MYSYLEIDKISNIFYLISNTITKLETGFFISIQVTLDGPSLAHL